MAAFTHIFALMTTTATPVTPVTVTQELMLDEVVKLCVVDGVSESAPFRQIEYREFPRAIRQKMSNPRWREKKDRSYSFYEFGQTGSYLVKFSDPTPSKSEPKGYCELISQEVDLDASRMHLLDRFFDNAKLVDFSQSRKGRRTSIGRGNYEAPQSMDAGLIDAEKHPDGFVLAGPDHSFEIIGLNFGNASRGNGYRSIKFSLLSTQKQRVAAKVWQRHAKRQNTKTDQKAN